MNNFLNSQSIADLAKETSDIFNDALNWTNNSKDPTIAGNFKLKKDLRKSIYQAKKIEIAAHSKMSVGVYGASQAGKSYLVSVLARKGTNRLYVMMGNQEVDFIETINPEGGKESTGLVTRFTTDSLDTPAQYPIQTKLLSEIDIIKTLSNSYAYDVSSTEDEDIEDHIGAINKVLKDLESVPKTQSFIKTEDVYELEDYCNSRFIGSIRFIALKKTEFWSRAADLLPNLNDHSRKKLIELLWEALPNYSQIYDELLQQLNQLDHAKTIFCSPEALFNISGIVWNRSTDSIINVSTLDNLGDNDTKLINVINAQGKKVEISRSTLTALVAELVMQMKERPHDFFMHTDLLDFPGARSRKAQPKDVKILNTQSVKVENFLRGKVAYLFDRYSTDLELSTMLLCVGPSNLEVVGLDKIIEDWIGLTHGEKPQERDKKITSLFLVMTKFDMEFSEGAGKSTDGNRWTTRLEASLLKPFAAHSHRTNWVNKWHTNSAFNNTYWLRNPNADQAGLIDSEGSPGSSKELGIRTVKKDFVNKLRETFLVNPHVNQHFFNPVEAWDAGMSLNDGGITRLITELAKVCKPEVKLQQILQCLAILIKNRDADLRKYHVSGDINELRQEKLSLAIQFVTAGGLLQQRKRLGDFIPLLLVSDVDAYDVFVKSDQAIERLKNSNLKNEEQNEVLLMDSSLAELLGLGADFKSASKNPFDSILSGAAEDLPTRFIQDFFNYWFESVQEKLHSVVLTDYLNINREILIKLLHEFEIAARRTGLVQDITNQVKNSSQYRSGNRRSWIWKQVAPITGMFNQFIVSGGNYDKKQTSFKVTRLDGIEQKIFEPLLEIDESIALPDVREDYSLKYFSDWLNGLQHTVKNNANFSVEIMGGDLESNNLLGQILHKLEQVSQQINK
jgi:hypothetical protein